MKVYVFLVLHLVDKIKNKGYLQDQGNLFLFKKKDIN